MGLLIKFYTLASIILCSTAFNGYSSSFNDAKNILKNFLSSSKFAKDKSTSDFYKMNNYMPLWFDDNGWQKRVSNAILVLQSSADEGLNPKDYELNEGDDSHIIEREVELTSKVLKYIDDLHGERFHPSKLHKDIDIPIKDFDSAKELFDNIIKDPSLYSLINLSIEHHEYQLLKRLLKKLRQENADPEKINDVIINMEKWRWMPSKLEKDNNKYVMVNIPSFDLAAYKNGGKELSMKVIIGKKYRHTPVFMSVIDFVRFNPSWYVPHRIAAQDKLPILQNNPSSLSRKGYRVYDDSGNSMDPSSVDWSSVSADNFNYRLVQAPGTANALGKVLFNIMSRSSIYLHSTPDKDLFRKEIRDFSSGCIRLENADLMAHWVLDDNQKWPLDKVQKAMEGSRTNQVALEKPIPVYITYFTIRFDDQKKPLFLKDIYGQNKDISKKIIG